MKPYTLKPSHRAVTMILIAGLLALDLRIQSADAVWSCWGVEHVTSKTLECKCSTARASFCPANYFTIDGYDRCVSQLYTPGWDLCTDTMQSVGVQMACEQKPDLLRVAGCFASFIGALGGCAFICIGTLGVGCVACVLTAGIEIPSACRSCDLWGCETTGPEIPIMRMKYFSNGAPCPKS